MKNKPVKTIFLFFSVAIYIFSLTQYCYGYDNGAKIESLGILFAGWIGVTMDLAAIIEWFFKYQIIDFKFGACFTWIANPLLIISWITFYKKPKISLLTSLFAALLSISFFFFKNILFDNEGNYRQIEHLFSGYYLWVCSTIIILAFNLIENYSEKKNAS